MMKKAKVVLLVSILLCGSAAMNAREKRAEIDLRPTLQKSVLTGWVKDVWDTRFDVDEYDLLATELPPGMVEIPGGSFTIGQMDEFITAPRNSERRTRTVSSFYMDKYEVSNMEWRIYEEWTNTVFGSYLPDYVRSITPDSLVWRSASAYNEPYEENYYRHKAYTNYPVVGVSWEQAMAYCQWRTDRVNEMRLVNHGRMAQLDYSMLDPRRYWTEMEIDAFLHNNLDHPEYNAYQKDTIEVRLDKAIESGYDGPEQPEVDEMGNEHYPMVTMYRLPYEWVRDHFAFNTEKYLLDTRYQPDFGEEPELDVYGSPRKANRLDAIFYIGFRLPTEAEWEYAAFAPVSGEDGMPTEGKIYPWSGYHPRDIKSKRKKQGLMMANFVRSKGDMSGVAGSPIDGHIITSPVDAFAPNDFGLYNIAGNVNEWVLDVYQEFAFENTSEYNPYHGAIQVRPKQETSSKSGQVIPNAVGCIELEYTQKEGTTDITVLDPTATLDYDYPIDAEERIIAHENGDSTETDEAIAKLKVDPTNVLAPRWDNRSRVYKGGSWNDRIYWLNPTTRRALDQGKSSSTIGFRCAMTKLGESSAPLVNVNVKKKSKKR